MIRIIFIDCLSLIGLWLVRLPMALFILLSLTLLFLLTKLDINYQKIIFQNNKSLILESVYYEDSTIKINLNQANITYSDFNIANITFNGLEIFLKSYNEDKNNYKEKLYFLVKLLLKLGIQNLEISNLSMMTMTRTEPLKITQLKTQLELTTEKIQIKNFYLDISAPIIYKLKASGWYTMDAFFEINCFWETPLKKYRLYGNSKIFGDLNHRIRVDNVINDPFQLQVCLEARHSNIDNSWVIAVHSETQNFISFVNNLSSLYVSNGINIKTILETIYKQTIQSANIDFIVVVGNDLFIVKNIKLQLDDFITTGNGMIYNHNEQQHPYRYANFNINVPQIGLVNISCSVSENTNCIKLDKLQISTNHNSIITAGFVFNKQQSTITGYGTWQSCYLLHQLGININTDLTFLLFSNPNKYQLVINIVPQKAHALNRDNIVILLQSSGNQYNIELYSSLFSTDIRLLLESIYNENKLIWKATTICNTQISNLPIMLKLKSNGYLSFEKNIINITFLIEDINPNKLGFIHLIRATISIGINQNNIELNKLNIVTNNFYFQAYGSVTKYWNIIWTAKLQYSQPPVVLFGTGTGTINGTYTYPVINGQFTFHNIEFFNTKILKLLGNIKINPQDYQFKISSHDLITNSQKYKYLAISSNGMLIKQKSETNSDGSKLIPRRINIFKLDWIFPAGAWHLETPTYLDITPLLIKIGHTTLSNTDKAKICFNGQWYSTGNFTSSLQISNLEIIKNGIVPYTINGTINIHGQIGNKDSQDLVAVDITVYGDNNRNNFLTTSITLHDLFGTASLKTNVIINITKPAILETLFPQAQEISGSMVANFTAEGKITNPMLKGQLLLKNFTITTTNLGLHLQNVRINIANNQVNKLFDISGDAQSDEGYLKLEGQLNPINRKINLIIKGNNFQIIKTTDIQIQISPELKIELTPQFTQITGTIHIPLARFKLNNYLNAECESDDVIIITNNHFEKLLINNKQNVAYYVDVDIGLGQAVYLETPMVRGKLMGILKLVKTDLVATRGTGNIEIIDGKYNIYGEEIKINRGKLIFSGSTLDQPNLDLQILRQERDIMSGTEITAYAQISGNIQKPKLSLTSNPKMSDQDILTYLILGRTSSTETAAFSKLATTLTGIVSQYPAGALRNTLGLDAVHLGHSKNGTAFVLGKYLTPKLYIGYGIGLFHTVNTILLKYFITNNLVLESETSPNTMGGDIIYSIER